MRCWLDCRIKNNPVIVNERIAKHMEYKSKSTEEKIKIMKSVYGDIIPEDEKSDKPFTYVKMCDLCGVASRNSITRHIMKTIFPQNAELTEHILTELFTNHSNIHKDVQESQGDMEDRKYAFTLLMCLDVTTGMVCSVVDLL